MDELRIRLNSNFMRGIITKIITSVIQKKLGYKINVLFKEVDVAAADGKIRIHINADAEMTNEEFAKIANSFMKQKGE